MVLGQTLQTKWEYRKKEDADSSDDGPDSTSSTEPVFKRLKPISDLMSNKSRKTCLINNSLLVRGKSTRIRGKNTRSKKRSLQRDCMLDERATMNGNLLFMHSILEELRVARENMIEWMRGEVQKMMADPIPDHVAQEDCNESQRDVVSMSSMHMP